MHNTRKFTCEWPAFSRHIELMKELSAKLGLEWDFKVASNGVADKDTAWDLKQLNGWPGKQAVRLRNFSVFQNMIDAAISRGVPPAKLARGPVLSSGWQDLLKAMMTYKCAVEQRLPIGMLAAAKGIRALGSLTAHEPWDLTADDVLRTIEIGPNLVKNIVSVCSYLDENFLCRATPLRPVVQQTRRELKPTLHSLDERSAAEKLPERTALYELVRIVWNEAPLNHFDEMRFYATRLLLLTGLRVNEIGNLPQDCIRIENMTDAATGRPASSIGGISEVMYLRYFAEKTASRKSARHLYEKRQYIPSRFQAIVQKTVEEARRVTEGLRGTLRKQFISGGTPFGSYSLRHVFSPDDVVQMLGLAVGSRPTPKAVVAKWAEVAVSEVPEPITVAFLEKVLSEKHSLKSDLRTFTLHDGSVINTADLLFLVPTKNANIRKGTLSHYPFVSVLSDMQIAVGLGLKGKELSLFGRYGSSQLRHASVNPHSLRHLMNTELFRLGVSDTIITHHFGRESVAQSYEYDHRNLLERLDAVELPEVALDAFGGGQVELVGKLVLGGVAEGSHITKTFKKLQVEHGDQIAFEYLKANADGFHVTPYGFCTNSFSLNPCSRHLKCFDECRHFMVSGSTEHTVSLESLRNSLANTRERVRAKPSKTAGRQNQLAHVEQLITGLDAALQAAAATPVFPNGHDHSQPEKGVFE